MPILTFFLINYFPPKYVEAENCLAKDRDYSVNLKDSEGQKDIFALYFVDSGTYAKEGGYAFAHNTQCKNVARGCEKKLVVDAPAEGVLYVSVFCETTVESHFGKYGTEYKGRTDVLNGVPYSIKVEIE